MKNTPQAQKYGISEKHRFQLRFKPDETLPNQTNSISDRTVPNSWPIQTCQVHIHLSHYNSGKATSKNCLSYAVRGRGRSPVPHYTSMCTVHTCIMEIYIGNLWQGDFLREYFYPHNGT